MVIRWVLEKDLVTSLVAASAFLGDKARDTITSATAMSIAPQSTTPLVDNNGTRVRLMETFLSVGSRGPGVVHLLSLFSCRYAPLLSCSGRWGYSLSRASDGPTAVR